MRLVWLFCILPVYSSWSTSQDYTFEWRYSLYAPYVNSEGYSSNWNIDALINNHHHVQLTPDLPSKSGNVFSKQKFTSDDWFIETAFQINSKSHPAGDGLALWFTEDPYKPGKAFGYDEKFKGLGVFFDIFQNGRSHRRFPYVTAMVNDGTKTYNHENDGQGSTFDGCHAKILSTDTPVHAKVIYHNNVLQVLLFTNHEQGWTPCLKVPNVKLPKSGYIGMTAVTGDASAAHAVISITTGSYAKNSGDSFANADLEESEQTHAALFFIILGLVLAGAGYHYFKQNKKRSSF